MAGIYLHIPFCARRCLYCDFFSGTDKKWKEKYVDALIGELELRRDYLGGERVETVYFGGGTPSQLPPEAFARIFEQLYRLYDLDEGAEITLEANPDDLSDAYVQALRCLPFNRLSMGVQSFKDDDLRFLNRRHTAQQARDVVKRCQDAGFANISIDLMYGLPGQTVAEWAGNLEAAMALGVQHVSAYHLIYEEGTALHRLKEAGRVVPVPEETSVAMFSLLIDRLTAAGFVHYEISNFGREHFFSRHNSSYWTGRKYLGAGASAHSFDGASRQWNVASLPQYVEGIGQGRPVVELELLDRNTRYNEFIITGLRTMWGVSLEAMEREFGHSLYIYGMRQAKPYMERGLLEVRDGALRLTREGIFISDGVMSDLLYV